MTLRSLLLSVALGAFWLMCVPSSRAQAQTRPARLIVNVADQTGAVLPGATVTVTAEDGKALPDAMTGADGTATVTGIATGRYRVTVQFPGFETGRIADVRVRAGDNRQNVVLQLEKLQDEVTVEQDKRSAAADPRGPTFGSALTREQIDALSDDPEEAKRQLQDLRGAARSIPNWRAWRRRASSRMPASRSTTGPTRRSFLLPRRAARRCALG